MSRNQFSRICVVAAAAMVASAAQGQTLQDFNRVANSTLEVQSTSGTPDGWTASSEGDALAIYESSSSVSTTHSLGIDDLDRDAGASWTSGSFAVRPGEQLAFQYYAAYYGISSGNFNWQAEFFDEGGVSVGLVSDSITSTLPAGQSFEPRGGRITVPSDAVEAVVSINSESSAEGLAFFDDISIDGNLLRNGRFESGEGNPTLPNDWFHGDNVSWEQLAAPAAPSGYSVVRITDVGTNGTNWRSVAFNVGSVAKLSFGAMSRRSGMSGNGEILLRFGTGIDASGNLTGDLEDEDQVITLTGDTVGFVAEAMADVVVPDGATYADLRLGTDIDPAATGTLDFDDAFVVATEFVPQPGDLNNDGLLNVLDVALMVECLGGPNAEPLCGVEMAVLADVAEPADGDVDLADYARLMTLFTDSVPQNLLRNPSWEIDRGDGALPVDWFVSSETTGQTAWYDADDAASNGVANAYDYVISGTHSAMIDDQSSTNFETTEWRSAGSYLPVDSQTAQLDWYWRYEDVDGDFFVTLAFFTDVDEYGNTSGPFLGECSYLTEQGDSDGWERLSMQCPVPENPYDPALPVSFDVRFRAWGKNGISGDDATGKMWMDDAQVISLP